jgi:hypothetical protein
MAMVCGVGSRSSADGEASLRKVLRAALVGSAAAAALLVTSLDPASAAETTHRKPAHTKRVAKKTPPKPLEQPLIEVSIAKQQLTLYDKGEVIAHAPVSTGMAGHLTPTGIFSVIGKEVFHRSNIYSGAPMPFMQRITWSGVALHAGVLPGYPASHGCIRMPPEFAVRLFHMTQRGARVLVMHNEVAPEPFESAHLFTKPNPAEKLVAPSVTDVAEAAAVVRTAKTQSPNVMSDVGTARHVAAAPPTSSDAPAVTADAPAPAPQQATHDEAAAPPAAPQAAPAAPAAVPAVAPAPVVAPIPVIKASLQSYGPDRPLRRGPITVFISKKEGKLYVRKGFEPVFSAPVSFVHPAQPLGTHLYTAIEENPDGVSFRWLTVTVPNEHVAARKKTEVVHYVTVKGHKVRKVEKVAEPAPPPAATAAEALDRIDVPQATRERIAALMSPGASLIISDKGLGDETGDETDFIVLTNK